MASDLHARASGYSTGALLRILFAFGLVPCLPSPSRLPSGIGDDGGQRLVDLVDDRGGELRQTGRLHRPGQPILQAPQGALGAHFAVDVDQDAVATGEIARVPGGGMGGRARSLRRSAARGRG